jgi:hypothetical protein
MGNPILVEVISLLEAGEQLTLLPLSRVLVEDAGWIAPDVAIFPPDALDGEMLRTVGWPEQEFQQSLDKGGLIMLEGDALHWAKSGATRIDQPDFFKSALLALPVTIDWDGFLTPASHEAHLDMLAAAMDKVERTMDLVRFENCRMGLGDHLPGRAGLLGDTGFCAGLFYAPEDHESYIIGGKVLTHQVIAGIGLDLTGAPAVQPVGSGEVGSVARHALRLYSEALEAATDTSRFVQLLSLIEFLAAPADYIAMKRAKRAIARQIARDEADYRAILDDFFYLTSDIDAATGTNRGLRHSIVHLGKRLEDLTTREERAAIFRRLARYAGTTIADLLEHDEDDWAVIEGLRAAGVARLSLTGEEAAYAE